MDCSIVICWTSPFVILGLFGLFFFFFFFFAFILFLMENPLTNNEDPDQKPHDIASDLGLHFLPMTLCGFPTKL